MPRILIIDDDESFRLTLQEILERKNYTVITAVNGAEGIQIYRENPADLVITDIIMPIKGGIRVIMDLKKEFPGVKIIAISGGGLGTADEYLEVVRILNVGATLKKPFSNAELLEMVYKMVGE
ncbi:MAG: response regulator [Candidatus Omnitrophica bacterium]|nr:response regulator [Candidatus Omnitrophota bacterium]